MGTTLYWMRGQLFHSRIAEARFFSIFATFAGKSISLGKSF